MLSSARNILFLTLCWLGFSASAAAPWEVAVILLGSGEPLEFQQDLDKNVLELARVIPSSHLRLSIHREFSARDVQFFPDPRSPERHPWDPLFFKVSSTVDVAGELVTRSRAPSDLSILGNPAQLRDFIRRSFVSPNARRLLVLHGHGLAYDGMKGVGLKPLGENLAAVLASPVDLLWLDSCFMANFEALYELRRVARRILASEDSEFSAGAPFEALQELLEGGPEDTEQVAKDFADRFLESYSFIRHGSQTDAVFKSSATISVIDPESFGPVRGEIALLAKDLKKAEPSWKTRLQRRMKKIQMEMREVVDFGSLLLEMKDLQLGSLKPLIDRFEVGKRGKLKTNSRIRVEAPAENSQLVWGYNAWSRGHEADTDVLEKLPTNLTPSGFERGPKRKRWPYRNVVKRLYLAPFTVGFNRFDFFFIDPRGHRSPSRSYVRYTDVVGFEAIRVDNPIRFSGYTQGVGMSAERYSGISIASPLIGIPNLNYMDSQFYVDTRWSDF